MKTTLINLQFNEKFKFELRIELPCKDKPGNWKNLPNNEGEFRKIEEKRLPLSPNPQLSFWKVFHSKGHIIAYLSAKFKQILKWCFYVMNFS